MAEQNSAEYLGASQGSMCERDESFMSLALAEAKIAGGHQDVPVGAVVVVGEKVIASGRNQRELLGDPTAHAEVLALRQAALALGTWRVEATLYVTQEPCPMCAGAIVNARVKRLVYGCKNPKAGAIHSLFELATDQRLNHRVDCVGGVLPEKAAQLLSDFFRHLRTTPQYKPE